MTEIPEHLLKRSRAAKGKGDDAPSAAVTPAASSAPAAAAPAASGPPAVAAAAAAIPKDAAPEPAKPEPHYIQAAKARKKMPIWAFMIVLALPIWAISFAGTMQEVEVEDELFIESAALYTSSGCAGCHGAGGGGGTGYQLSGGEVIKTFPAPIDMMVHVARGSAAIGGEQYGDPNREGGARIAGNRGNMPAQIGALTELELELVIFHERTALGGEEFTSAAYLEWMEHLRERIEEGDEHEIEIDKLLACADPAQTPGATGEGLFDDEGNNICAGPHFEAGEEIAAG